MVKLEEVEDEAFSNKQPGDEGDWDTDDGMLQLLRCDSFPQSLHKHTSDIVENQSQT